ncbi:TetR/AcrR family transcriptional regulator [Amycolatopsis sp. NPDC005961]|uniref:TetR/AcrR family transcriptional regulator n=1 Tax=Amycolatopsis sp. NPDC005961 TaxID=3156720 RepID=UPI0033F470D8
MVTSPSPAPDRRVRRSQAALQQALLELVEETDLTQLTVADVAEHADVNRSTFYAHYRDVHELAEAACTAMIDDLLDSLAAVGPEDPDACPSPALTRFFAHLAEHAGLYRSLLGPGGSARVLAHLLARATATIHASACVLSGADSADDDYDVPAGFAAGGLVGVAVDWLDRGCPRAPIEMAVLTKPLVLHLAPAL